MSTISSLEQLCALPRFQALALDFARRHDGSAASLAVDGFGNIAAHNTEGGVVMRFRFYPEFGGFYAIVELGDSEPYIEGGCIFHRRPSNIIGGIHVDPPFRFTEEEVL